jgi:hypothetical protein
LKRCASSYDKILSILIYYFIIIIMAMAFASIASRALPAFRTIWSFIKASPTLSSIKDAVVAQVIRKGT